MNDFVFLHLRKLVALAGLVVLLLGSLLVNGCPWGGPGGSETITGKVTSGGKAVASGTVTILASDNRVYQAPIRPDGTYEVTGVPAGPFKAAVASANPAATFPRGNPVPPPGAKPPAPQPVPGAAGGARIAPGAAGGGGGGDKAKQKPTTFGVAPSIAPGDRPAAPVAPPAGWVPVPGKYATPQTSGLGGQATGGRTQADLSAD